jgi:hypothetical protein
MAISNFVAFLNEQDISSEMYPIRSVSLERKGISNDIEGQPFPNNLPMVYGGVISEQNPRPLEKIERISS